MPKRASILKVRRDYFYFWVRSPSISYSFSLEHDRLLKDPYREMQSLYFAAECISPNRFKSREATALFFARETLRFGGVERISAPDEWDAAKRKYVPTEQPQAIGSIMAGKNRFEVSGFLAPDVLWQLGAAMSAGTITSMNANALWVGRGHAYLSSVSFHGPHYDPLEDIG